LSAVASSEWLWTAVDRILAQEPSPDDLIGHRIQLLCARRWRDRGLEIPSWLAAEERLAAVTALTAPMVLDRIREACDGPVVLLKGPETAAFYPDPTLRRYWDIDVLVLDAPGAQRALEASGWQPIGDPEAYDDLHHLRPLAHPALPLAVEVHDRPKWVDRLAPVEVGALFEAARPAVVDADGIDALPPAHHALLLAAHSWSHEPFGRLRDVLDCGLVAAAADQREIEALAAEWGLGRLWSRTRRAIDALATGARLPRPLAWWARNIVTGRERTVLESHLTRCLSPFEVLPPGRAMRAFGAALVHTATPRDEPWRAKARRSARALRNHGQRRSEHETDAEVRRPRPAA